MPKGMLLNEENMKLTTLLLAASLFTLSALQLSAGTRIDNVVMDVDSRGRASAEITNISDQRMGYVLTPYEWKIDEGEDIFSETKQFMALPPTFQLGPGETITVRVGFRNPTPAKVERTFRLSVREVPNETAEQGLTFAYNHMLPVYVAPTGGRQPSNIEWSLILREGSWYVRAENKGNSRAVLKSLSVDGKQVATSSKATILAQSWREYAVPSSAESNGRSELAYEFLGGMRGSLTVDAK
ncbi:molecular chaperone [Thalassobius vesicularis]|uniref:Molecular chaperone n=1 Tax=Thalassobius vesicularis TaxID=1294297 RepID=A0A4S3M782_9RHOB|nr:fimbria/pilus periplasmic chaperone [Thalassobius vesicularis]THD71183.1 molecular chaperone [Thalassobius vesicularis]